MPSPFLRGSPGSAPTQFAVSGSGEDRIFRRERESPACLCPVLCRLRSDSRFLHSPPAPSVDGSVRVWRLPDRTLLHELRGHSTWVCAVADLGNGVAASGGEDGTLRVWDCAHGKLLWDADVGREMIYAICAAPGGFVACSTGDKGAVQVWGVSERTAEVRRGGGGPPKRLSATGNAPSCRSLECTRGSGPSFHDPSASLFLQFQHVATLEDHTDAVFALTVVSNPTEGGPPLLASASKDTTIRVWEVGSWECVGVLVAHTDSVVSVVRHPA